MDITPKAQAKKKKEKKQTGTIKQKFLCTAKETISKRKMQLIEWEEIFTNHIFDKKLIYIK